MRIFAYRCTKSTKKKLYATMLESIIRPGFSNDSLVPTPLSTKTYFIAQPPSNVETLILNSCDEQLNGLKHV